MQCNIFKVFNPYNFIVLVKYNHFIECHLESHESKDIGQNVVKYMLEHIAVIEYTFE